MPELRLTEIAARRTRDAARTACGAKPGHLAEALAAALGHGSHAALLASVRASAPEPVACRWDADAFADRLRTLDPTVGYTLAARAAEAALLLLSRQPASEVERISDLVHRVASDGGGTVTFQVDGRSPSATIRSPGRAPRHVAMDGLSPARLADELVLAAGVGREAGTTLPVSSGTVPASLFGLPRDNVPARFHLHGQGTDRFAVQVNVPPKVGTHAGLDALGLPDALLRPLREASRLSPGLRIVAGRPNGGKRAVARLAAYETAGRAEVVEVEAWKDVATCPKRMVDGFDGDVISGTNVERLSRMLDVGVAGRVILLPSVLTRWEANAAKRLAKAGACVWVTLDAGGTQPSGRRASAYGLDGALCRLIWDMPEPPPANRG